MRRAAIWRDSSKVNSKNMYAGWKPQKRRISMSMLTWEKPSLCVKKSIDWILKSNLWRWRSGTWNCKITNWLKFTISIWPRYRIRPNRVLFRGRGNSFSSLNKPIRPFKDWLSYWRGLRSINRWGYFCKTRETCII